MAAWLLARAGRLTNEPAYLGSAEAVIDHLDSCQRSDGSWWYGQAERDHFIDHYHSGMLLVARKEAYRLLDRSDPSGNHGFRYYRQALFDEDLRPKFRPDGLYPVDVHCVAQAILTLLQFPPEIGGGWKPAHRLAQWAVQEMWDPSGYFHFQLHRSYRNGIPYIRWGQAWMLYALSALVAAAPGRGISQIA